MGYVWWPCRIRGLKPGTEDDPFDDQKAWLTGVFGVLYTVSV